MAKCNSGLAQAIALRVIHDGNELDSMADTVEELISSAEEISSLLKSQCDYSPAMAKSPEIARFLTVVSRAKDWK
jgi:hypothetical protein